jgi:predicted cobalt transporter CbtA
VTVPFAIALAVLPPAPDAVDAPATLIWRFRLASLGGNLLLWSVLTVGFGVLAAESCRRRATASPPTPARQDADLAV